MLKMLHGAKLHKTKGRGGHVHLLYTVYGPYENTQSL